MSELTPEQQQRLANLSAQQLERIDGTLGRLEDPTAQETFELAHRGMIQMLKDPFVYLNLVRLNDRGILMLMTARDAGEITLEDYCERANVICERHLAEAIH